MAYPRCPAVVALTCAALLGVAFVPTSWSQEQGSNGFAITSIGPAEGITLGPASTTVGSLPLPAGNYIVNATVNLINRSNRFPAPIACSFNAGEAGVFLMDLQQRSRGTLAMNTAIALSAPGVVSIICASQEGQSFDPITVRSTASTLTAISVATLTIY